MRVRGMAVGHEQQGVVSVFLGSVPTEAAFREYLHETYTDDTDGGVGVVCPFWADLGVNWFDHDFQDMHYAGEVPVSVAEFLSVSVSHLDSFRDALLRTCEVQKVEKVNAGVFLYDFAYSGERRFPSRFLAYVGTFPYEVRNSAWFTALLQSLTSGGISG